MAKMDLWMEKFTLLLLLLIVGFTLLAMRGGVTCFFPPSTSNAERAYATAVCSSSVGQRFDMIPYDEGIPKQDEIDIIISNYTKPNKFLPIRYDDNPILAILMSEIVFAVLAYSIVQSFINFSNIDAVSPSGSHKMYFKVPAYILLQLALGIVWCVWAKRTFGLNGITDEYETTEFMCSYKLRLLGNTRRTTLQCITNGIDGMAVAIKVNIGLCLVIAVAKLLHIVATFVIQPAGKISSLASKLEDAGIIGSTSELGIGFVFSDLYYAIAFHGDKVLANLKA